MAVCTVRIGPYPEEDMQAIREKAKQVDYLKGE